MPESKLHVYSAHFEPRPLAGIRFANPDIAEEFKAEMMGRWESLQGYLDVSATPSTYECGRNSWNGIDTWRHIEGGLITPVQSGLSLPPKPYALLGLYDIFVVTAGTSQGLEYEMEVLMKAGYEDIVREAESIMQVGLPSSVTVKKMRRLYADEVNGGFSARIVLDTAGTKNFRRN